MVLLGNRAGEFWPISQQPRKLARGPQKQVHPHGKVGRVQQSAAVCLGHGGDSWQSIVPAGGAGYGGNAQLQQLLEIVYGCVGPGEFQSHITASQPSLHEGSASGILIRAYDGVHGVTLVHGECRERLAHPAIPYDRYAHQQEPKNSWCSRRTTSGPSSSRTTNVMLMADAPWEMISTFAGHTALNTRPARPGVCLRPIPTMATISRPSSTQTSPSCPKSLMIGPSRVRSSMVIEMLTSPLA